MANMEHSKRNKKEHRKGPASHPGKGSAKKSSGRFKSEPGKRAAGRGKNPAEKDAKGKSEAGKGAKGKNEAEKGARGINTAGRAKSTAVKGAKGKSESARDKGVAGKSKGPAGAKKSEQIRLNKYIAHAGICSRREADKLIAAGLISVNGSVVTEVGTKIDPDADVRYNGERLGNERKVYLLLNKPKDFVTTVDDPHAKKTVMELVQRACKERIYPVGRLDRNTTGVLLFTNDGDLTRRLTHPSFNKKKVYHVFLDKNLQHSDLNKIAEGIELEDGFIQPDAIAYASMDNKREIGLEIHSGKNRVVRRIFEHLGYKVTKLDRVYFAGLTKKNLPRGRWRFLTDKEIKSLKMNAFE